MCLCESVCDGCSRRWYLIGHLWSEWYLAIASLACVCVRVRRVVTLRSYRQVRSKDRRTDRMWCNPVYFSVREETDCHPQGWKWMTDRPITGSVAVYATLLQPIERHFILIWPSVCPVTNNPDEQQQEEGSSQTPTRAISMKQNKFPSTPSVLVNV